MRDMRQIAGSRAPTRQDEVVAATPPPGRTTQTAGRASLGRAQLHVRWDRVSVLFALVVVLAMVVTHSVVVAYVVPRQRSRPNQHQSKPLTRSSVHNMSVHRHDYHDPCPPAVQGESGAPTRTVALTFDDGAGPSTPAVLDVLQQAQVPATFFVVGKKVAADPEMLRRILAAGHALGNHTWSHKIPRAAAGCGNRSTLAREIERTGQAVLDAGGLKPCLFRPPGGIVKGADRVSRTAGLSMILWSIDTRDWADAPGGDKSFAAVIRRLAAAGLTEDHPVILLHDGGGDRAATVAALAGIIEDYRANGYRFVTLDKMT